MGMPWTADRWTADRVRALPDDGNRYELVDGELVVTPAPVAVHQRTVGRLSIQLDRYLARTRRAEVLASPADLALGEDEILQPDLFVVPLEPAGPARQWGDIHRLLLAIEVISPGTARYDRQLKRRRYQRARVPEYWIVDTDARLVERWRPNDERPEILSGQLTWAPFPGEAPLELDLAPFFAEARGELVPPPEG